MDCTTWTGQLDDRRPLRRHFKNKLPHLGLFRINEAVATDTVFPAEKIQDFNGNSCAQIFVGMTTKHVYCVLMKSEKEGPAALQDFIRDVGVPTRIHHDRSKMQLGRKFRKICRDCHIKTTTTEAHHPNQNFAERIIQEIKKRERFFINVGNAPPQAWGHAFLHATWCYNRTANSSNGAQTPSEALWGETPDLSPLQFRFHKPFAYLDSTTRSPNHNKQIGWFICVAENVGSPCTFWIKRQWSDNW